MGVHKVSQSGTTLWLVHILLGKQNVYIENYAVVELKNKVERWPTARVRGIGARKFSIAASFGAISSVVDTGTQVQRFMKSPEFYQK
jgi:hypothetical protein